MSNLRKLLTKQGLMPTGYEISGAFGQAKALKNKARAYRRFQTLEAFQQKLLNNRG